MFFNHKGIKTAKRDFTNADLSPNRKKQFFGILHDEWKLLLLLSFFFLLLFAPYLSVSFYSQYRLLMGMESDALSFSLAMETVKSLCLLLPFLSFGGLSSVYRRLYLGEGVLFWKDFFSGIKPLHLLFGIVYGSFEILMVYLSSISGSFEFGGAFYFLALGVFSFLIYPLFLFGLAQLPFYSMKANGYFSNGGKLALKHFGWMFLFSLLPLIHHLLGFLPLPLVAYDVILCLLAFLTPVYVLTFSGFAISKFDLYLNAEFYPSLYRKGLRKEENKEGKSEK